MKRFVLLLCLISTTLFGQLPPGVDPASVTKADLDKYGVTEGDLERLMQQYGGGTPAPAATAPAPAPVEEVKPAAPAVPEVKPVPVVTEEAKEEQVFGRSLFKNKNLSVYTNASHIKASPDYILGAGDELSISIWGYSEHSGVYTIGSDGAISPKLVGKIFLKGQSFEKALSIITSKFGKVYDLKNSQISIELNYSKVIRVNIVGEVEVPGTYSVPSINSIFNILSLAGGVSKIGSVRDIKVMREGKVVKTLDVYRFLQDPSYKGEFFLVDNDYIIVSPVKKVVTLAGDVRKPMKYELTEKEGLQDLLNYGGGMSASAYDKLVLVHRFKNNRDEILEVDLDSLSGIKKDFQLEDGDRLYVRSVPSEIRNRVSIEGPVNIPGDYLFKEGMTVKDLIEVAEGLQIDAYLPKAYLTRINDEFVSDRIEIDLVAEMKGTMKTKLKEFDLLSISSKKKFNAQTSVDIIGSVRSPGTHFYSEGMSLSDLIFLGGGFLPEATGNRIEISRLVFNAGADSVRHVIASFDVDKELLSKQTQNIKLQPYDIVFVRNIPDYNTQKLMEIAGEVMYPGVYSLASKKETVKDIIERAGGLTDWAFLEGAYIERKNQDGGLDFMVFSLSKLMKEGDKEFNYILKEGDRLVIPTISNFVSISGEVNYYKVKEFGSIKLPYKKGKRAKYYVNKYASGFSKEAKRSRTYVETPGGYVKRTKNFGLFKIYPKVKVGDKIVVLPKEKKEEKVKEEKEPVDWNQAIERATIKLTGLATLYILLQSAVQ